MYDNLRRLIFLEISSSSYIVVSFWWQTRYEYSSSLKDNTLTRKWTVDKIEQSKAAKARVENQQIKILWTVVRSKKKHPVASSFVNVINFKYGRKSCLFGQKLYLWILLVTKVATCCISSGKQSIFAYLYQWRSVTLIFFFFNFSCSCIIKVFP